MSKVLKNIIERNRAGERIAIPSVCSAQPDVLKASLLRAEALDRPIVIEATSNQVNQYGGYTGMRPDEFVSLVHNIADSASVDRARITFGGDHLGPQAWRALTPEHAMAKAHELVRSYVEAGFTKVHLDCSEGCKGDPSQLGDEVAAARSAELAQTCMAFSEELLFVVGTEVPPPGGARISEQGDIEPTSVNAAIATLDAHKTSFGDLTGLIGALVVQPGVEFTPTRVHHMPLTRTSELLSALADWPNVCLEAHSTDYQNIAVFPHLASLGFAFQKVGPALTFAYRQALYALDQARGLMGGKKHGLQSAMEVEMMNDTQYWQNHYHGDVEALFVLRHFSLADRIRYYWAKPAAQNAVANLREEMSRAIPDSVLWQTFGERTLERAESLQGAQVQRLIDAEIQIALDPYLFA